jgi:hypothetical protein
MIRKREQVEHRYNCDVPGCTAQAKELEPPDTSPLRPDGWLWLTVPEGPTFDFCPDHHEHRRALALTLRMLQDIGLITATDDPRVF